MNKKTALISLYSDDVKGVPPLALLYLATALKKQGLESKIIHRNAKDFEEVIKEVEDYGPALVGMSVFTGYHNKKYVELSRYLNWSRIWITPPLTPISAALILKTKTAKSSSIPEGILWIWTII